MHPERFFVDPKWAKVTLQLLSRHDDLPPYDLDCLSLRTKHTISVELTTEQFDMIFGSTSLFPYHITESLINSYNKAIGA